MLVLAFSMMALGVPAPTSIGINNVFLLDAFNEGGGVTVYLTVFAIFIIALSAFTGGIGTYGAGGIYVTESGKTTIGFAIVFASFDFIYEVGKFLLKWLFRQEKEKPSPEKPEDTNMTDMQGITK